MHACVATLIEVSIYSGTSDNGHSEEWTTSLQWTNCPPPTYIIAHRFLPLKKGEPLNNALSPTVYMVVDGVYCVNYGGQPKAYSTCDEHVLHAYECCGTQTLFCFFMEASHHFNFSHLRPHAYDWRALYKGLK